MPPNTDLGCLNQLQAIRQLIRLDEQFIVDIGCGDMLLSRSLAENGAKVLAIDRDPIVAEKNRSSSETSSSPETNSCLETNGAAFVEASADQIPVDDQCVDGIFLVYALHHIDVAMHESVFQEAMRVLKPDGFVFVIQPLHCPIYDVINRFNDERESLKAAEETLVKVAAPRFQSTQRACFHSFRQYKSFDDFATHFVSKSFNELYREQDVRAADVQDAFEALGHPDYRFMIPRQITLLKCPRRSSAQ